MSYFQLLAKLLQRKEKIKHKIVVRIGNGDNKLFISADSWLNATLLMEQAMIKLDDLPT